HYEPSSNAPRLIRAGDILLIDLWAREEQGAWADQTWMASLGPPSGEAMRIWEAVRDARDRAIALVQERARAGEATRGSEIDDAARGVIRARGYAEAVTQ